MKKILFTLFLFILISIKSAYAEQSEPASPVAIQCKTKQTCDRNPEHLEKFVKEFYKWYLSNIDTSNSPQNQQIINQNITLHFQEYINNTFVNGEIVDINDQLYCSPGINYFTCSQDEDIEAWIKHSSSNLVSINTNSAVIALTLPSKLINNKLLITLKPENGYWKIHSILKSNTG